jgi:hypothetical protein
LIKRPIRRPIARSNNVETGTLNHFIDEVMLKSLVLWDTTRDGSP